MNKKIFYLKCFVELVIFGAISYLCEVSSKDPFKYHIIGNITNYFYDFQNQNNTIFNTSINKYINETLDQLSIEEGTFQGSSNIYPDNIDFRSLFRRKLASFSFCTDMQESFGRNEGKRLSYIFDLNYQIIRKLSISIVVVVLSFIILFISASFLEYYIVEMGKKIKTLQDCNKTIDNNENNEKIDNENTERKIKCLKRLRIINYILIFFSWVGKFVLSLLLYHFIENGDIQKYEDFLDCSNVRKKFFEKFSDIKKLRRSFLAFAIVNIISESVDKVDSLVDYCEELGIKNIFHFYCFDD